MAFKYDDSKLKELLNSFYILTNMRIGVFDSNFQEIAVAPDDNRSFCAVIRSVHDANQRCMESDKTACEKCKETKTFYSYICHAGLSEIAAPIHYGNIVIGYLVIGQVLQCSDYAAYWEEVKVMCSEYDVDFDALYEAYCDVPIVTDEEVFAAAKLLEASASYLWLQRHIMLQEDDLSLQIDQFINGNLSKNLSAPMLCEQFNISRSKLYRVTQESYGQGIMQVIRDLRMKRAKELLAMSNKSINEIAALVGYSDYNYFIKVFKTSESITPAKYKKQVQHNRKP